MVKRDLFRYIGFLLLLILGLIALRVWFFEPVTINEQMANNYLVEKDVIFAEKNAKLTHGDFVLYSVKDERYVGRVIALEGDSVTYMDDVLYRNSEIVHEDYLDDTDVTEYYTEDMTIATLTDGAHTALPKDSYLILNDNRTDTRDSREFGLIQKDQIIGRLSFRIRPFSQFGFIENGLTQ